MPSVELNSFGEFYAIRPCDASELRTGQMPHHCSGMVLIFGPNFFASIIEFS